MADYIDREALLMGMDRNIQGMRSRYGHDDLLNHAIDLVQNARDFVAAQKTVDVAPVVRCDNCRHMKLLDGVVRFCKIWNAPNGLGAEGYCSYGEKRG